MADLTTIGGNLIVRGNVSLTGSLNVPDGSVDNDAILAGAGVDATKLEHQTAYTMAQAIGTNSASRGEVVHVVYGATATIVDFYAGVTTAAGAATTLTVDLKVNGTTRLTSVISITNTLTAYTDLLRPAGYTSVALVAEDVVSIVMTLTGANPPQGAFATVVLREDAA